MKQYWLTAISALMGTTLVVLPILGGLFGDTEGDDAYPDCSDCADYRDGSPDAGWVVVAARRPLH